MDLQKNLQEIKNHFSNITPEEFKENLKVAGFGQINSCESEGMELIPIQLSGTGFYYNATINLSGLREFCQYPLVELGDVA